MTFVKLANTVESIDISETTYSFDYKTNMELKVNPKYTEKKQYLKIELESKQDTIEYVLSYYQNDSKFKDRKQLSQSISGKAFIYLKKEQVNQEFYISVLSENSSFDYTIKFIQKDKMELNLGEQYSYYVTGETKNMEFSITGTPEVLYNNTEELAPSNATYKLSIWATSSKSIKATLNNFNDQKDIKKEVNGFNAYLLQLEELKEFSYTFTVEGNLGDLIKVGVLFFSKENLCQTIIKDHKMEIFGYLKDYVMERVYFLTPKLDNEDSLKVAFDTLYAYDYSFHQKKLFFDNYNNEFNLFTYAMEYDKSEQFYLFQFSKNNTHLLKVYSPLILGGSYRLNLKRGEKVGLLPMFSNNEYLTYQTTPFKGNHQSSIVSYTDYPFCKNEDKNKETSLLQYYSSSITYNKNEYNNKSPIDHNQKLLVLTCESKECKIYVNIYTEKNHPTIFPSHNYYKYIRKGSKDNFIIDLTPEQNYVIESLKWFINIEVLNGKTSDLNIIYTNKNVTVKNNKILYENYLTKLRDIPLTIEATKKNIIYSIMIRIGEDILMPQINYLMKYDQNLIEKIINFDIDYYFNTFYVGINLFNENEFNVFKIEKLSTNNIPILQGNKFYQDIKENEDMLSLSERYNITKSKESNKESFFEMSLFKYYNNNILDESIILPNNIVRPFIFTEKYTQFKFMYLLGENKNDLTINIKLLNNTTYKMDLFVNNEKNSLSYTLNKTKDITIPSKEFPNGEYQPIKVEFVITSEVNTNSTIEINIKEIINQPPIKESKSKISTTLIIIVACAIVGIILILLTIVIVMLCKSKKSYEELKEKVNSVSFKADNDDDLLD